MDVLVIASSSVDAGIGCWDLKTGAERLRYKGCASPSHGLTCVGNGFLAASQHRERSASGSVFYWSWDKPQVEVKSFPTEHIRPLAANGEGAYLVGGSSSGHIYLWEVATGRLLKKWQAHYRLVTCLAFSEDDSLLVSGSQDGSVRVWPLLRVFDQYAWQQGNHIYEHSFTEHAMPVTDVVIGYGGCNAIIVSASEDRTCKVWSLSKGILLRNIVFPAPIDAITLDPGEHVFYAGSRDGKIYVAALNAKSNSNNSFGMHILGSLSDHSKAVTCLTYCADGNLLLSGSEDGMIRVWDPRTRNIVRIFRYAKCPVNNIQIVSRPVDRKLFAKSHTSSRKHGSSLPPPLEKYTYIPEEGVEDRILVNLPSSGIPSGASYLSHRLIIDQIEELQQRGSAASQMEIERLKLDCNKSMQMVQQWEKMFENLHRFCVHELLEKYNA